MAYKKRHEIIGLAERLKELRKKLGLTQEKIADRAGVKPRTIQRWENGSRTPDISSLACLCKLFDVSADYLLFGKEDN